LNEPSCSSQKRPGSARARRRGCRRAGKQAIDVYTAAKLDEPLSVSAELKS